LPAELHEALDNPLVGVRIGAIHELRRLLRGRHGGLALAAERALRHLADDDSRAVAAAATAALTAVTPPPQSLARVASPATTDSPTDPVPDRVEPPADRPGPSPSGSPRAQASQDAPAQPAVGSAAPATGQTTGPAVRRRWVIPVAAAVGALLVAAVLGRGIGGGLWPNQGLKPAVPVSVPPNGVFNAFDLAVQPGTGYDLDIPPGKPADWHATSDEDSPDYAFLDLYRISSGVAQAQQHISGVDPDDTNEFNAIHPVADTEPPTACRGLSPQGGGRVKLGDLRVGTNVCLRTHEGRWAMITVLRMPADGAAALLVHVTVLAS
jgi:hypothetical protein